MRWTTAVEAGDIEQLGRLMTVDVVVVHGNGRGLARKEAVMEDFAHSLRDFLIKQTVEPEETIVAGEWAFDRAAVHTVISSRKHGDEPKQFNSKTITILRKESSRGWCVARAMGVIDQQR
jgi:ketosteroid isomerase-like protein